MVALPVTRSTKQSVSAGMSGLGMLINAMLLLLHNDAFHKKILLNIEKTFKIRDTHYLKESLLSSKMTYTVLSMLN